MEHNAKCMKHSVFKCTNLGVSTEPNLTILLLFFFQSSNFKFGGHCKYAPTSSLALNPYFFILC